MNDPEPPLRTLGSFVLFNECEQSENFTPYGEISLLAVSRNPKREQELSHKTGFYVSRRRYNSALALAKEVDWEASQ